MRRASWPVGTAECSDVSSAHRDRGISTPHCTSFSAGLIGLRAVSTFLGTLMRKALLEKSLYSFIISTRLGIGALLEEFVVPILTETAY